ncbi:hypothetical protein HI914_03005 [Erysiphe necator]|nr:hypothetical protein HI914_03005 [Erysiphe necator]
MPKDESLQRNVSQDDSTFPDNGISILIWVIIVRRADRQSNNSEQHESWKSKRAATNLFGLNRKRTHDCRLAQVDAFRNAKQKLQETLHLIEEKSTPPNIEYHSGELNCFNCDAKNKKILDAYKEYFLTSDPNAWYAQVLDYEVAMQTRFRDIKIPTKNDLKDLYIIFRTKLREYIMTVISDLGLESDIELSKMLSNNLAQDIPLENLVQKAYHALLSHLTNPDAKNFVLNLQKTRTAAERAPIYIQYYCSVAVDDTPQQKNFKAKHTRMFENCLTHDEVLTAMRKEAQDLNSQRVNALHTELGELQLAQSAHIKKKLRKEENIQQVRDRNSSQKSTRCSLVGCEVELDLTKENIECAVCEWLERKCSGKGRFFYCTVKHAEEDFDNHDRHEHKCVAGHRCIYYLQAGSPAEISASGICSFCVQNKKKLFYFCSKECYHHNIEWHANQNHDLGHQREKTNVFETFKCSPDMQILSKN